jgi:hypothetical protein
MQKLVLVPYSAVRSVELSVATHTGRTGKRRKVMRKSGIILLLIIAFGLLARVAPAAAPDPSDGTIGRTPPRLSYVEGQVSFWRPGTEDWTQAQLNTALAPGDQLFAGPGSRMEIQIGAQAFMRGGADTQIGLESHEPDFLQLKVTTGQASLDVRAITAGRMIEVSTPNAAFLIRTEGYYRLDVGDDHTEFITRRAGRATAISAGGDKIIIGPNEATRVDGPYENPSFANRTAPPLDDLDQWNYARSDGLKPQQSARYVSPEVYGVSELDRHGTWRVVPTYGAVWIPTAVPVNWAPYSTGVWMHDPFYGWTWVDTMPWGWAPFHYGRWVRYSGSWCWAPGPRVIRPVYAPALVAFYGQPGVQVSIGFSSPVVGWVSLGWGEPLIPWWGRPGFIHRPWWGGWAGPRIVNNRVVHHTTVVRTTEIHVYRNMRERNALVVIDKDRFGRGPVTHADRHRESHNLRPTHAAPRLGSAHHAGLVPSQHRGIRPPESHLRRPVVTTSRNLGAMHPRGATDRQSDRQHYRPSTQQSPGKGPQQSRRQDVDARIRPNHPMTAPQRQEPPLFRPDAETRTRSGPPAGRPYLREGGSERRQNPSSTAPRPSAPDTPPHPRVARPETSEPRSPGPHPAARRPAQVNRPAENQATPPPGAINAGGNRSRPQSTTAAQIEPGGRVMHAQERPGGAPAMPSAPKRPQAPNRSAAPAQGPPTAPQAIGNPATMPQPGVQSRSERPFEGRSRNDSPGALQRYQGREQNDAQRSRQQPQMQNRRNVQ